MREYFLGSVVFFAFLLGFIPPATLSSDTGNTLLTVIAFLFGIIAGFYIVITTTDYNSLKGALAQEAGALIALYQNLVVYDEASARALVPLIDEYVRRNFDFELIEYMRETEPEFNRIEKLIMEIPYNTERANGYQGIQETKNSLTLARQHLYVLGARTLSLFQWGILGSLSVLFIGSLYSVRTGSLFFDIVTVALSSAVVLVLLLIRDLDRYVWNEQTFGFEILQNVFRSIGQLPYYPSESVVSGRILVREKEYRVGILVGSAAKGERKIEVRKVA